MELSSSKYDTKNWTFEYDSNFFQKKKKRLTEFNLYSSNMTKELAFFLSMTQRIEPFIFWIWRTELNPLFSNLYRIEPFFSKNWTPYFWLYSKYWIFFLSTAQRIEPCFLWLEDFFLKKKTHRIELFFKSNMTQRIRIFYNYFKHLKMTQRIELFVFWVWLLFFFFSKIDSQNWTFFPLSTLQNWTFFFSNVTRRIESFSLRLKELHLIFFKFDCENWTPSLIRLKNWTRKIWLGILFFNITERIELFWIWLNDLIFRMTPIELNFCFQNDAKRT